MILKERFADRVGLSFTDESGLILTEGPISTMNKRGKTEYLLTSIDNNSYGINGLSTLLKGNSVKLYLKITHLSCCDEVLRLHKILLRNQVECIIFDTEEDPRQYTNEIKEVLDCIGSWGLYIRENEVTEIEEWKEVFGFSPNIIMSPINPFWINLEVINYCKENEILVATDCPYGNRYIQEWMLESFTAEFLLKFSLVWTDLVFFPGSSVAKGMVSEVISSEYCGKEISDDDKKLYSVSKSIFKDSLFKYPKRLIRSVRNIGSEEKPAIITPTSPYNFLSEVSLAKKKAKISREWKSVFEKELSEIGVFEKDEFKKLSEVERMNYARIFSIGLILSVYDSSKVKIEITYRDGFTIIGIKRRWFSWLIKPVYYFITLDNDCPKIYNLLDNEVLGDRSE